MAEVSVASSEFGGEQSIGLCVVGFLPPTGLYNTVLLVRFSFFKCLGLQDLKKFMEKFGGLLEVYASLLSLWDYIS